MTRIHITDTEITIKRSDLPSPDIKPYPDHDPENGVVSFEFGGTEVFHNTKEGYEQWLPEMEGYILNALGALIASREIDAELGKSIAEKLEADLRSVHANTHDLAAHLVAAGWRK